MSAKLIGQFADCLAGKLAAGGPGSGAGRSRRGGGRRTRAIPAAGGARGPRPRRCRSPRCPSTPDDGVEPIDLLAVSGVGSVVRRAVPYVVTAAASFAVVFGIIWWIRRR